ncbi:hypothetical protein EVAR_509_1 [Eumeta japonica]|uniref:Uncharacterized protein n=1 Tax=Eumeta variegata TaxID=151549 RepID=A0A4C1SAT5_EUMVA|nr:hypothetical protein EVAR_509_1 [Eumeta japonica]
MWDDSKDAHGGNEMASALLKWVTIDTRVRDIMVRSGGQTIKVAGTVSDWSYSRGGVCQLGLSLRGSTTTPSLRFTIYM